MGIANDASIPQSNHLRAVDDTYYRHNASHVHTRF